jgi:hypothetical protein
VKGKKVPEEPPKQTTRSYLIGIMHYMQLPSKKGDTYADWEVTGTSICKEARDKWLDAEHHPTIPVPAISFDPSITSFYNKMRGATEFHIIGGNQTTDSNVPCIPD